MLYPKTVANISGPEYLIFDLQEIAPIFNKKVEQMKDYEASLTEVMEILPTYINEALSAEDGLRSYTEHIVQDHERYNAREDGEILAGAVLMMGQHFMSVYASLGLWRDDGVCHYIFERWLDPQSPLFRKVAYEDLYTYDDGHREY